MTELMAAGGCYNSMRYARNGAGAGSRDWVAAYNTAATMNQNELLILAVCIDGDDMNDATDATFKIQWENNTDAAGIWNDLAAGPGEIKWSSSTDLVEEAAVTSAEDSGGNAVDCTGKGWGRTDGLEKEGANGFTRTVVDDFWQEFHWAIDLSGADHVNGNSYGFRLTQSDDTVIGTMAGLLTVVTAGTITGTTKNANRTADVVSVQVTAYLSDGASPPKPTGDIAAQTISSGSNGTYALTDRLVNGEKYFLLFFKDDTSDLSDGSPEVTATAA